MLDLSPAVDAAVAAARMTLSHPDGTWKVGPVLMLGLALSCALTLWGHARIERAAYGHLQPPLTNPPSIERELTIKLQRAEQEIAELQGRLHDQQGLLHDRQIEVATVRSLCQR